MKYAAIVIAIALTGCNGQSESRASLHGTLNVFGPDKYGVVCYAESGTKPNPLSCVQVQEGVK